MSRWADWFPMDASESAELRASLDVTLDDERRALVERLLERKQGQALHVEIDKAWEPIHRCLTGDHGPELDFDAGERPLSLCVLGGEQLLPEGHRTASLVSSEDVLALAGALKAVRREWLRERFFALPDDQFHELDDEAFEWIWEHFELLCAFFEAVARAGAAVVCTISH